MSARLLSSRLASELQPLLSYSGYSRLTLTKKPVQGPGVGCGVKLLKQGRSSSPWQLRAGDGGKQGQGRKAGECRPSEEGTLS